MEGKIDITDVEGQFGKPELFSNSGVRNRMDEKFPHHPLMKSEARYAIRYVQLLVTNSSLIYRYKENWEQAELNMLRKTMGMAMPMKLSMEKKVTYL